MIFLLKNTNKHLFQYFLKQIHLRINKFAGGRFTFLKTSAGFGIPQSDSAIFSGGNELRGRYSYQRTNNVSVACKYSYIQFSIITSIIKLIKLKKLNSKNNPKISSQKCLFFKSFKLLWKKSTNPQMCESPQKSDCEV